MSDNTVLFVDDEINVLNSLKRGLIYEDYNCMFVQSGAEAVKIIENEEISVIVSDMRMPGMDGLTLLKFVKEKSPSTVRVVLSGYTQLQQVLATINQADIFKFITKPWKLEEEFIHVVRQAIEYYNLQKERDRLKKALEARNVSYQKMLKLMEEKLATDKKDFNNIKCVGKVVSDNINRYINNIKDSLTSEKDRKLAGIINSAQRLYLEYIETVPAENIDFDLKKLASEFQSFITDINSANTVVFNENKVQTSQYYGNFILVMYIIKSLCSQILQAEFSYNLAGILESEEIDENTVKLEFKIDIKAVEADNNSDYIFEKFYGKEVEFINIYYNEICKFLKGNILVYIKDKSICVNLKIYVNKQDLAVRHKNLA